MQPTSGTLTDEGEIKTVALPSTDVSRSLVKCVGCCIAEGNRVLVKDLKSTNGTFIDEEEIEAMVPNELKLGDEVIFGASSGGRCQTHVILRYLVAH